MVAMVAMVKGWREMFVRHTTPERSADWWIYPVRRF